MRDEDAVTGGAAAGIHRTDFTVSYREKNMLAYDCSTGQKAFDRHCFGNTRFGKRRTGQSTNLVA